ncbi:hypothetical protein ACFX11_004242 [Malus domestica]
MAPSPLALTSTSYMAPSSTLVRFRSTSAFPRGTSFAPMLTLHESFACTTVPKSGEILVAGGGSSYTLFSAAGSRTSSVEWYDIGRNEWGAMDRLPSSQPGAWGFLLATVRRRSSGLWVGTASPEQYQGFFLWMRRRCGDGIEE